MKLEVVTDASGIPLGITIAAANCSETDLIEKAIDDIPVQLPDQIPLVADRGYDSDPLRDRLAEQGIDLISPHRKNRIKPSRNDGRKMRRCARRYVIERTNSWLHSFVESPIVGSDILSCIMDSSAWLALLSQLDSCETVST